MKTNPLISACFSIILGVIIVIGTMAFLKNQSAFAASAIRYVATNGIDSGNCTNPSNPCRSVQYTIDQANNNDEIRIAQGVYTNVTHYGGLAQIAYISKSLTIRGGYTTVFTEPPNPDSNPTVLDAQGQGRVIYITGSISQTVEGLSITGGDANGLGGGILRNDGGGGIYVVSATLTLRHSKIYSNVAVSFGGGTGGGILLHRSSASIINNSIFQNDTNGAGIGGGVFLSESNVTLKDNIITDNVAESGGGVFGNNITLESNVITNNQGRFNGGGIALSGSATLVGNLIFSNTTTVPLSGGGGGVSIGSGVFTLTNNVIISNSTTGLGGGLYLQNADTLLTNNVIANNRVDLDASGIFIARSSSRLIHNTIISNSGADGSGVHIADGNTYGGPSTVTLTNTIIASQTTGIVVMGSNNPASLNGILWFNNGSNSSGAVVVANSYTGNPAFAADGYHLTILSTAHDKGVSTNVTTDIDGQSRPSGVAPDLGADEFPVAATSITISGPITGFVSIPYRGLDSLFSWLRLNVTYS